MSAITWQRHDYREIADANAYEGCRYERRCDRCGEWWEEETVKLVWSPYVAAVRECAECRERVSYAD